MLFMVFLQVLAKDGRLLGGEFSFYEENKNFIATVKIPEKAALKNIGKQKYIVIIFKVKEVGLSEPYLRFWERCRILRIVQL
jgi:hypothetical protein